MPVSTKTPPTALEGLKTVFTEIANLTVQPDSLPHMQFLQSLMQGIQQYLVKNAMQAVQTPMGGGQAPQVPQGGGPMPGGPPPGAGGPMMGAPNAGNINPDELRRMLGAGGPVA